MIDIHAFINSLKCSWIKRLKGQQSSWKIAYNNELSRYCGDLIFKCNIKPNDAKTVSKRYNFLNEILVAWSNINYNKTIDKVSHEMLWHNTLLKRHK